MNTLYINSHGGYSYVKAAVMECLEQGGKALWVVPDKSIVDLYEISRALLERGCDHTLAPVLNEIVLANGGRLCLQTPASVRGSSATAVFVSDADRIEEDELRSAVTPILMTIPGAMAVIHARRVARGSWLSSLWGQSFALEAG